VDVATVPTDVTVPVAVTPDAAGVALLPVPVEVDVGWPDPVRPPEAVGAVEGVTVAAWPTASRLI
jgi:hypothetical protein